MLAWLLLAPGHRLGVWPLIAAVGVPFGLFAVERLRLYLVCVLVAALAWVCLVPPRALLTCWPTGVLVASVVTAALLLPMCIDLLPIVPSLPAKEAALRWFLWTMAAQLVALVLSRIVPFAVAC